jgi:hypothetical protein
LELEARGEFPPPTESEGATAEIVPETLDPEFDEMQRIFPEQYQQCLAARERGEYPAPQKTEPPLSPEQQAALARIRNQTEQHRDRLPESSKRRAGAGTRMMMGLPPRNPPPPRPKTEEPQVPAPEPAPTP